MSTQNHFGPCDHRARDLYARERVLNSAIIAADIGRGWEEYLEIFGGPLTGDDLNLNPSLTVVGHGRPS